MTYSINCNLNGDIVKYHKKLVKEIANNFDIDYPLKQKFKPHFTLKYEFETNNINELEKIIEDFCNNHKKAKVQIGGFNNFRKNVIFLETKLSNNAYKIFLDLLKELKKLPRMNWNEYDGEDFKFHSTIAANCEEKFDEIFNYLKNKEKIFDCFFDNITIIKTGPIINGITTREIHKIFKIN